VFFYGDSVGSEIKSMIDELKCKIEKDRLTINHRQSIIKTCRCTLYMFLFDFIIFFFTVRQTFAKALTKSSKEVCREQKGVKMRIKLGLLLVFQIFECVINGCIWV
jgi:hypothetical protein